MNQERAYAGQIIGKDAASGNVGAHFNIYGPDEVQARCLEGVVGTNCLSTIVPCETREELAVYYHTTSSFAARMAAYGNAV